MEIWTQRHSGIKTHDVGPWLLDGKGEWMSAVVGAGGWTGEIYLEKYWIQDAQVSQMPYILVCSPTGL